MSTWRQAKCRILAVLVAASSVLAMPCAAATGGASPTGELDPVAGSPTEAKKPSAASSDAPADPAPSASPHAGAAPSPHAAGASPHGAGGVPRDTALRDHTAPDPAVPRGAVDVTIADGSGKLLSGVSVKLEVLKTSIATGNVTETRTGVTDDEGRVRFAGENTQTDYSYRVMVERSPALYASQSFLLQRSIGQRVVLNLYPVTRTLAGALVVMVQQTSIEPKEGRFRFATTLEVQNFGRFALVPENLKIRMPRGAEAFQGSDDDLDRKAAVVGDYVELRGTYPPGGHRVSYAFDVPSAALATQTFDLGLAPFLRSLTLAIEAAPGMTAVVPQLGEIVERQHSTGQRVLLATRDYLQRREHSPGQMQVTLQGLPTPSPARNATAIIAALVALFGVGRWAASRRREGAWRGVPDTDLERAKELLLDELVELENAYRGDQIGPRTYERARQTLLDALSRLLARPTSGAH